MKTKGLAIIIILVMVLALFSSVPVKAQNGPSDEYAFIYFTSMTDFRKIYDEGTIDNEALEGATYDRETNTLTLNNVDVNLSLDINKMGDDFKIKLVGENSIAMICSYADDYGGSVTITGDGVLNVDTSKFGITIPEGSDEEMNAITFYAENTSPKFTVEDTATVNIKAHTSVIAMINTPDGNAQNFITLKNGQNVSVAREKYGYYMPEEIKVLLYENTGVSDTYRIYRKDGKMYGAQQFGGGYTVDSQPIGYYTLLDLYFFDPTFNSSSSSESYNSEEEILAAGYEFVEETDIHEFVYTTVESLFIDANGKEYIPYYMFDENGNMTDIKVYELSEDEIVLSDGVGYKMAKLNDQVDGNSLTAVRNWTETENYNYRVNLKSLNIPAKTRDVIVEAADDTSEDIQAKEEVSKLINEIVQSDEGTVEGINDELADKIREKVEAGETIYVEVVSKEVKAENIEEDAKKIEDGANGNTIVSYFDIDIVIKTASEELGTITNLKEKIKISIDAPEGLPAVAKGYKRVFKVIRVHDGKVDVLDTTVEGGKITFESDLFSTFALAYKDEKITKNPRTGDNIILYFGALAIAVVGLAVTIKTFKKSEE